jgi:hypothetical protein
MACERELIAEIKRQDRERALRDREVKRDFIRDELERLFKIENTIDRMIERGFITKRLFDEVMKEIERCH